ncbi:MAG TPA: YraN family protein [Xanthomonadales bacterium]|nr:YraN family protein [Xanthomonadales bacterium]
MSRAQGSKWERVAERWLKQRNARIVCRNYHCRSGEIDLVIRDGDQIAFVEVKFRALKGYGSGADHVTFTKQRRIVSAARRFLQYHKHASCQVFRFDVISITNTPDGLKIQWIKSAFEAV